MKPLYMLKLQALILLFGSLIISCSEDNSDDPINPIASNAIAYNGTTYEINNGFIEDYGPQNSFYNYNFTITDGSLEKGVVVDATVALFLELYAENADEFITGTFNFQEATMSQRRLGIRDYSYFTNHSALYIEQNGDGLITEEDEKVNVTAGTVTVTGSQPNYTLEYDLTFENGETLQGSYEGSFTVVDKTEEDNPEPLASYFKLGEQSYRLTQGLAYVVNPFENDSTGRFHEIMLMDDGFSIDNNGNYAGEGIWLLFTLVAKEPGKVEGEYKIYADYGSEDDARNAPDFSWLGLYVINGNDKVEGGYNEIFESNEDQDEMTIIINKLDDTTYEIDMNGTGNGRSIEVYFKGNLTIFL